LEADGTRMCALLVGASGDACRAHPNEGRVSAGGRARVDPVIRRAPRHVVP
jgi:hypothetical protein